MWQMPRRFLTTRDKNVTGERSNLSEGLNVTLRRTFSVARTAAERNEQTDRQGKTPRSAGQERAVVSSAPGA